MKTLEEAMACVMRPADPNDPPEDRDITSGENLASLGRDIDGSELCQIYVNATLQYCVHCCEDPHEMMHMFGMAMLTAGVRIGIEMEKP